MKSLPCLLLLAACAGAAAPLPGLAPQGAPSAVASSDASPARLLRCQQLADSTSRVATRALPTARTTGLGRLDAYPRDVRDRMVVRAIFRVRPDGSGDLQSLVVTGSSDADFRRALERAIGQMRAQPAMREGCPVWSREEYMLKAEVRVQRMG